MSDNLPSTSWTYHMEVSATGQSDDAASSSITDPVKLLQMLVNLSNQNLEVQRQILDLQRQQLDLSREATQFARDQRTRQQGELERWQNEHQDVVRDCQRSLKDLEEVHVKLMFELTEHVSDHKDNLLDSDFALSDFVDKFGPRLAHINTILSVLRPLAAAARRREQAQQQKQDSEQTDGTES